MVDARAWAAARAASAWPAPAAAADGSTLLTLHRPENVDDPARLAGLVAAFAGETAVLFPVHPRTRAVLERCAIPVPANVVPLTTVGYLEMVALEARAHAIATDSGGVQKEAYLSGVPCITLRSETEWVETVEAGWNRVVDADPKAVAAALRDETFMSPSKPRPALYGDGRTAQRIVAALERHHSGAAAHVPQEEFVS